MRHHFGDVPYGLVICGVHSTSKGQGLPFASEESKTFLLAIDLLANNKYYKKYWEMHKELLENDRILTISSFDLFINYTGIDCAMDPVLYLETAFTDTGILETYRDESGDTTTRTVSFGHSWTMKVCSGVRVYGESNHLAFFL